MDFLVQAYFVIGALAITVHFALDLLRGGSGNWTFVRMIGPALFCLFLWPLWAIRLASRG